MSRRLNAGFELFGHGHGYLATLWALGRRGGGARNGTERIPMLSARDATPLAEEVTGSKKGPISLALGSWCWRGGYGGGEGWGLGVKGRGVAYFLPQTCANIYHTGVFQKYVFCS